MAGPNGANAEASPVTTATGGPASAGMRRWDGSADRTASALASGGS